MGRAEDIFDKIKKDGQKAIDEFILTRKSEDLFLDFKRSADQGSGRVLHQNDRNNLAKAISGFGNSEGGVVVWGIDCSKQSDLGDVARAKFPLVDVKKFTSLLENTLSGLTIPPHTHVENYSVQINKKGGGFAVSLIAQNLSFPIQTVYNKQFYIRAGSNFEPAPYQVLSGMFGRRPQPFVFISYTVGPAKFVGQKINLEIGLLMYNRGPGIAKDMFVNSTLKSSPGPNCQIAFETPDIKNWSGGFSFGRFVNLISKPTLRLPPEAHVQPLVLNLTFLPPFNDDLEISIMCGSGNSAPMKSSLTNTKEQIELVYSKYLDKVNNEGWTTKIGHEISKEIMGRKQLDAY
ncbi:MAG: ATP-binding protein [Elusimicrobia bacterium]|nr:ATP-binding protein [Patescibacteria group bacterium]MBU1499803.1 ATP-binding protein [Patescibacteria group bacterium]MBU2567673.1 ATP-binding protein [Elusimicrobiota bacterium]